MSFISRFAPVITLIATASLAFAENAGPDAPSAPVAPMSPAGAPASGGVGSMLPSILLMVGIVGFMYFVLIRPQKKEEKKRKEMLSALKRGDKVVTIGGVHGTVETIGAFVQVLSRPQLAHECLRCGLRAKSPRSRCG